MYSLIRTSGHLTVIIVWGEDNRNPLDFTSISMENLNIYFFLIEINPSNVNLWKSNELSDIVSTRTRDDFIYNI